jgi:hypothetical protein
VVFLCRISESHCILYVGRPHRHLPTHVIPTSLTSQYTTSKQPFHPHIHHSHPTQSTPSPSRLNKPDTLNSYTNPAPSYPEYQDTQVFYTHTHQHLPSPSSLNTYSLPPLSTLFPSAHRTFTHVLFFLKFVISCPFITESPKPHLSSRNSASNQPQRNHVQEHLFPHRSLSAQSA